MSYTVVTDPQRSPEWFAARAGRLTGSVADVLYKEGKKKGEPSVARRDLILKLACERLTGMSLEEEFTLPAHMQRGIDKEADAFAAFEAATGLLASTSGFLSHDSLMVGCSLDGHVGDVSAPGAILEAKCPKTHTHIGYIRAGVVPPAYIPQVTFNMWMTGAPMAYFVSFDDRLPAELALLVVAHTRDEAAMADIGARITVFLAEVDAEVTALETMRKAIKAGE
jgi:hypothetical protein